MINTELDISKYWNELSIDNRTNILIIYQFWDGFSNYKYEYLPQDLKNILWSKIDKNGQFSL
jgi:hypothetical protein